MLLQLEIVLELFTGVLVEAFSCKACNIIFMLSLQDASFIIIPFRILQNMGLEVKKDTSLHRRDEVVKKMVRGVNLCFCSYISCFYLAVISQGLFQPPGYIQLFVSSRIVFC